MAEVTIVVTLEHEDGSILRERAEIVTEHIRSGMFGCDAPDSPDAWRFRIFRREGAVTVQ